MVLYGVVSSINDFYGSILCDDKQYSFDCNVVYGEKLIMNDDVMFRVENGFVKMVSKYEKSMEEILDVD